MEQNDPQLALLNYRNTRHSSMSPAFCLMSRQVKDKMTDSPHVKQPEYAAIQIADSNAKQKRYQDQRHGAKSLSPLITKVNGMIVVLL